MPVGKRSRKTQKKRLQKRKRSSSRRRVRKQRGGVRLYVTGPSGTTHALNLEPGEPVGSMKPLLEELEGLTPLEQHLSFSGAPLDDGRSIADAGLGEDAAIQLARIPFAMPLDQYGDPDFGPRIEGSLAEWRAANPNVRVANISYSDTTDADFVHLRGIRALNMNYCRNITDAAFEHIGGIHTLSMVGCRNITNAAFEHLRGIHTLDMAWCNQRAIGDAAFANLEGIYELDMSHCTQPTITDRAFPHLTGIHVLKMVGCSQPTITDDAFEAVVFAPGSRMEKLIIRGINTETITDDMISRLIDSGITLSYD